MVSRFIYGILTDVIKGANFWKKILHVNYSHSCYVKMSLAFYLVETWHPYVCGCQSVRQEQSDFVFCCLCLEL